VADETSTVFGIDFYVGDLSAAADVVVSRAREGLGGYICQCSVHGLMASRKDPLIRRAHTGACIVFPDGAPVAWLERRAGARQAQRIAGPDLLPLVVDRGRATGLRHFFYGGTDGLLTSLEANLLERFPGAKISGAYAPPTIQPHDLEGVPEIRAARPHVVWCGLGHPKQELWMQAQTRALAPALLIGVGAALEFNAGSKRRAPCWMQVCGLEWAHRLASEPRRLTGRYLTSNTRFVATVIRERAWRQRSSP